MCKKSQIIDPTGVLYGKKAKYADPLGITKTAIGDPTGDIRKERSALAAQDAADKKAQADADNVLPNSLAEGAAQARSATAASINQRLRRRSAFAISLLNQPGSSSLLGTGG